MQGIVTI